MKQAIWALLAIFILLGNPMMAQSTPTAYDKELGRLYKFTVPTVEATVLATALQGKSVPVLLDTRTKEEYMVSHLPGALFVDYDRFKENSVAHLDRNASVVVYCTVGYRSERIGERLQKMGFTQVRNLYGGIFEWVNEGNVVVGADGKPTNKVHAYSESWGKWLTKGEKVYQ